MKNKYLFFIIKWFFNRVRELHVVIILNQKTRIRNRILVWLINSVLYELSKEVDIASDAIVIKLNGLVHHDDKIALKSITAQMQLENAVGDRVFGTFAENLSFLLSCLQSGADRRCKSMVFVLEEFDMFCHSGRTQTLLYNLFDITHTKQAPMCVLGTTNRLDVMELLEKRVKSRFSHRHIFLFSNQDVEVDGREAPARSPLELYKELLVILLSMPACIGRRDVEETPRRRKAKGKTSVNIDELIQTDDSSNYTIPIEDLERCKVDIKQFRLDSAFIADWNTHIQALAATDSVVDSIEKFCYYINNEQIFRDILFQIVSHLSPNKPYIDATDVTATIDKTVAPEHRVKLLQSLSILELSLVIAMKHGMEIFDGQPMNFEMVLHRYTKFANANSSTQTVPRPVILKAFEHLQALEIILPVRNSDSIYNASDTTASRVQKEYKLYTLAVPIEDINEAVKNFKALPTEISHWYNNSVV
ncbi:origin recognition complex subunit 4 isoform X2 [Galleria mellonella]|uniref:Origin recognition complex subunit 4 n=1 Tax=Galleria mellonella TaxID=7137 RepID=A0ABM3MSA0_GALME|nr:origin recognition complex subunit 4 isoform X2 [Galleria mellonella]